MSQILREVIPINVLGATNVGKTSLIQQYTNQYYETNTLSTIGYEFKFKNIKIKIDNEEKNLKLKIWDTSGQEIYFEQALISLKNCLGALIIYDITDKKTFDNVDNWIDNIYNVKDKKKFPLILIGNKIDLKDERIVTYVEGKNFAQSYNVKYFETSAITREGIVELFENICQDYSNTNRKKSIDGNIKLDEIKKNNDDENNNGCCG